MNARALAALFILCSSMALADPAERALTAARDLEAATLAMQAASGGRDQIAALTQTIQAYEDGLVTLRDGLRDAQLREVALEREFAARSEEMSRLLSVLMATQSLDESLALLHPQGALETARAAMLLGELTPPLARAVAELRDGLDDLRALRRARQYGFLALEQGLQVAQDSRVALAQAVSNRGPLPKRLVEEPAQLDALARNALTLEEFAQELAQSTSVSDNQLAVTFQAAKGTLPPPVRATILHRFNQPDAAGVTRQGLVLATGPDALVTAPWSGTVRYAGPLARQGDVVILEPSEGILLVLAGLANLLVATGEVVTFGAPLGTMPGGHSAEITSGSRSQTLYFEVRDRGNPIDPEPWFAFSGG